MSIRETVLASILLHPAVTRQDLHCLIEDVTVKQINSAVKWLHTNKMVAINHYWGQAWTDQTGFNITELGRELLNEES